MIVELTGSDFAKNLAELRKKRGMSQKDLAEQAGVSEEFLRNLEDGVINPILDYVVLRRLRDALHTSIEVLTGDA